MRDEMQPEMQQNTAEQVGQPTEQIELPVENLAAEPERRPERARERVDVAAYQLPDPIQVRSITVRRGRIVYDVVVADPAFRYTTPKLAAFATRQYPDLPLHACVNNVGTAFGSVIESTSVPHMLEHLAIDIQTRNASAAADTFVGTTEWLDERAGIARVEMSFKDDLEALKSFNEATRFLNTAVITCLS